MFKPMKAMEKKEKEYIKSGDKKYIAHEKAEVKAAEKNAKRKPKAKKAK